jgi:hypothetical protein
VTGTRPATLARNATTLKHLPIVTAATAALVAVAVGLYFRSLVAPVVNLLAVGIAYLVASRGLSWLGRAPGVEIPREAEPVAVVLLFGVVTDCCIFFLSSFRDRLREGCSNRDAAIRGSADVVGIVFAAGSIVALAASSLFFAVLSFLRVFGPWWLAATVLLGAFVAVTFVPGVLAIGGRFVLWPRMRTGRKAEYGGASPDGAEREGRSTSARVERFVVHRPLVTAAACVLLLVAAATGLSRLDLGNPIMQGLPEEQGAQRAYTEEAASEKLKERWGSLSYPRGALEAAREFDAVETRLVVDGTEHRLRAVNVVVGNCRYAGGGWPAAPGASPEDGLLDLVVVTDVGLSGLLSLGPKASIGADYLGNEGVFFARGKDLRVQSEPPERLEFNVDGELIGHGPAGFDVLPRAVKFVVGPGYTPEPAS